MGKTTENSLNRNYCTNIIYKKSNTSIQTVSRTQFGSGCSGYLQRSNVRMRCSKISQNTNYYVGGGKTKRDICVETRYAMSRRLLLERRKRLHDKDKRHRDTDDTRTVNDSITQTSLCRSGCGDSNPKSLESFSRLRNVNMDEVMMDNLKSLVNKLLQIFDNKAQNRMDKALCRMFQCIDGKEKVTPFLVEKEETVNEKPVFEEIPITCQFCKQLLPKFGSKGKETNSSEKLQRCSGQTHPFQFKNVHIVSTLSIPRKSHSYKRRGLKKYCKRISCYKMKKGCNKNIFLSINKSKNTIILDSSNVDIVAVTSQPSRRKRYCNITNIIKHTRKRITTINDRTKSIKPNVLNETTKNVPSLMNNIFAGTGADIAGNAFKSVKTEICTNTDPIEECQVIAANLTLDKTYKEGLKQVNKKPTRKENQKKDDKVKKFIDETVKLKTSNISPKLSRPRRRFSISTKKKRIDNINSSLTKAKHKMRRNSPKHTQIMTTSLEGAQLNKFSYLYKKVKDREMNTDYFLKQLRDIFEYFANYDTDKDIKLDVNIKVYPTIGEREDKGFKILNTDTKIMTAQGINNKSFTVQPRANGSGHSILENYNKLENSDPPAIFPLLDGALSQEIYLHTNNNTIDSSSKLPSQAEIKPGPGKQVLVNNIDILNEIGEVKAIITGLANIAEKYIKENLHDTKKKRVKEKRTAAKKSIDSSNTNIDDSKHDVSTKEKEKTKQAANAKKQRIEEIMAQESVSYNVIDSECLVRVTDMTSAANANKYKQYKEPLHSRSYNETTDMKQEKTSNRRREDVIHVYTHTNYKCKSSEISGFKRPKKTSSTRNDSSFKFVDIKRTHPIRNKKLVLPLTNEKQTYNSNNVPNFSCQPSQPYQELDCVNCCETVSTIVIDIEEKPPQSISVSNRNVSWWSGLAYSLLMLVPACIVLLLFFKHVIAFSLSALLGKESPKPADRMGTAASKDRMPYSVDISMSDLGF